MSARKPLARMDSPATIVSVDEGSSATDGVTVEATVSKTVPTENGEKTDGTTTPSEPKELKIKEEKLDPEETGLTETTQADALASALAASSTEIKRVTRNSPLLLASPLKKKLSDSQEQESSAESTSTIDEGPKKTDKPGAVRTRKHSDVNSKSSSNSVPPTNRLTRKSAAQDLAANTRFTRARRGSAGIGARPETPPKRKYVFKKNVDPPTAAVKRKRSVSPKPSLEEPEVKISKAYDQDTDIEMNAVTVKQEILESSEEMASDVASDITELLLAEPTSRISLRARKGATSYSPSTRTYRRDKDKEKCNTEATTSDSRRKRLSRVRADEDSKDSLSSSVTDDVVDVKVEEKFQSEDANEAILEQTTTADISPSDTTTDKMANGTKDDTLTVESTESIDKILTVKNIEPIDTPLTVDTTEAKPETHVPSTSAAAASEQSNSSDKAASLSPDLVSEGVSEISVKRFYKKPAFLENNLGIEKDPKLGEIVQNVAEKLDDTVDATSVSNESIKEGELVFEEEEEEVASIGSIRNDNNGDDDDDANSVSTGFISPLLVEEEDEEEDEIKSALNGDEKVEETSSVDDLKLSEGDKCEEESKKTHGEAQEVEMKDEVEKPIEVATKDPSTNESVQEIVQSNIEETNEEVNSEPCDNEVEGDIKKKDISKEEQHLEDEKAVEDTKLADEPNSVSEKKEIFQQKEETVEKMELDESKIEESKAKETKMDITITDQEENKENVELGSESIKEVTQDIATTPEKESSASMSTDDQEESLSESSKTTSPTKTQIQGECSADATTPSTSPQSSVSSSVPRTPENDEKIRQKERHFKTLGLLTHKAADEAIMAKQKRRKFLHNLSNNSGSKKSANTNAATNTGSAAGNGQNKSAQEYTGTLKTVIKLNRQSGGGNGGAANEPKKGKNVESGTKAGTSGCGSRRHSLKMTFQKGRGRPVNTEKSGEHPANTSGEDSYYTIQNEGDGTTTPAVTGETTSTVATTSTTTTTHGRKSYNRSNTTDATHHTEVHEVPAASKKDEKEEILIPEKASSFKFHPGRLCEDQCYYCSGRFGLYDTPCHVGQIKSVERQQKILANEEKLTVDNCLCDACFRHVDRRANVPSYKKRLSMPGRIETVTANTISPDNRSNEQETPQPQKPQQQLHPNGTAASSSHTCAVPDCGQKAAHSLRRKGIRKSIKKSLLNFDMSTAGTYLHICEKHYEAVVQSSGCVLCKRRLGKTNMYHITTDTDRLEKALAAMGIPVSLGQGTAVCKLCRYFANLLMKPPEHGKVQKVEFVKNYRKRLLQFYNIHEKKDTSHDDDEEQEKPASKKQNTSATSKRLARKSHTSEEAEEGSKEPMSSPPSPVHSTGSSVEMISDSGVFNADETPQRNANTKSVAATATTASSISNQMVLDNDVMVDYDVPMISDSSSSASSKSTSPSPQRIKQVRDQQSKLKAILQSVGTSLEDRNDISTALRSNPNISMRELFPGEEDLGLQFKAPFGSSSSQRTPEGWTRINTFLQYDEPTRRLWEDLQKPYGNQSSFLRHLILLEKYYRNGDLILSSNASSNATVYTQTVRNRLTSFDSGSSSSSSPSKELENRSRSLSVDKIQRQLSSNSVTITARPKEPKPQQKEGESSKQKDGGNSTGGGGAATATSTPNSRSILKTNLLGVKGGAIEIVPLTPSNSTSNSPLSLSGSSTPNDSSLLTKQQKILAAANKLMINKLEASPNQKKTLLNTTPPELISLNRRPVPALNSNQLKRPQLLPKPMNSGRPIPPNVIVLPDTLTSQERLESKSWRPTLLPVTTTSHHLNNQQGPLYQTADGRRLPALVQVQSGGKPFLISIHDYNRMCILRREKLMRDQMLKGSKGKIKGIFPPATCIPNNSGKSMTNNALQSFNKTMQAVTAAENAAKKQRFILGKNANFTPIAPKPTQSATATTSAQSTGTSQLQSQPTVIGTLQPINILSSTQTSALSILPNFQTGQVLPLLNPSTSTGAVSTASVSGVPTNSWLWNNFPESNQMLNGKSAKGGPQATLTSMKQQSLLLDNSLMSKIPKSLTVIPQHKLMPAPSGSSAVLGNITKD